MEILVFSGVRGHPCESATLLRYLTEMSQKEHLSFSQAPVSSVPGWLSLGIIHSQCDRETGNCLAWSRVEQSSLQASLCRNVFRGTLEWDFKEGRSFTFVCRKKKYFLGREKISTLISHLFQDAFTADCRQMVAVWGGKLSGLILPNEIV